MHNGPNTAPLPPETDPREDVLRLHAMLQFPDEITHDDIVFAMDAAQRIHTVTTQQDDQKGKGRVYYDMAYVYTAPSGEAVQIGESLAQRIKLYGTEDKWVTTGIRGRFERQKMPGNPSEPRYTPEHPLTVAVSEELWETARSYITQFDYDAGESVHSGMSPELLQRDLKLGNAEALAIFDELQQRGYISRDNTPSVGHTINIIPRPIVEHPEFHTKEAWQRQVEDEASRRAVERNRGIGAMAYLVSGFDLRRKQKDPKQTPEGLENEELRKDKEWLDNRRTRLVIVDQATHTRGRTYSMPSTPGSRSPQTYRISKTIKEKIGSDIDTTYRGGGVGEQFVVSPMAKATETPPANPDNPQELGQRQRRTGGQAKPGSGKPKSDQKSKQAGSQRTEDPRKDTRVQQGSQDARNRHQGGQETRGKQRSQEARRKPEAPKPKDPWATALRWLSGDINKGGFVPPSVSPESLARKLAIEQEAYKDVMRDNPDMDKNTAINQAASRFLTTARHIFNSLQSPNIGIVAATYTPGHGPNDSEPSGFLIQKSPDEIRDILRKYEADIAGR